MPHDLQADHEIESTHLSSHLYDTIDSIGGVYGIGILTIGIVLFYLYVEYTISNGRKKREDRKKRTKLAEQKLT